MTVGAGITVRRVETHCNASLRNLKFNNVSPSISFTEISRLSKSLAAGSDFADARAEVEVLCQKFCAAAG